MRGQRRRQAWAFTVEELAQMGELSVRTVRRAITAGRLQVHRDGKKNLYVTVPDARRWLGKDPPIYRLGNPHKIYKGFSRLISVRACAEITGLTERQVRALMDTGDISRYRVGHRIFVNIEEAIARRAARRETT
jgi:hypothetical protein